MQIMLKTDVVFYAIFHVEHIMSSTHVVYGSALLLDERWSSFLPKKSSLSHHHATTEQNNMLKESTIIEQ